MNVSHRLRAVLEQLPADEREFFERDPALSWLASVIDRFASMSVEDAAAAIAAEIPGLRSLFPAPESELEHKSETSAPLAGTVVSSGDAVSTPAPILQTSEATSEQSAPSGEE